MAARCAQRTTPTTRRLCWLLYVSDTRMRPRSSESPPSFSCTHAHITDTTHEAHEATVHPLTDPDAPLPCAHIWRDYSVLMVDNVNALVQKYPHVCYHTVGLMPYLSTCLYLDSFNLHNIYTCKIWSALLLQQLLCIQHKKKNSYCIQYSEVSGLCVCVRVCVCARGEGLTSSS